MADFKIKARQAFERVVALVGSHPKIGAGTVLALVLALGWCSCAHAQEVTCPPSPGTVAADDALLCWTNATVDVNGNPIPTSGNGSLKQNRVQRSTVAATADCAFATANAPQLFNVTPDVTRMLFENLAPGKWCFRVRHVAVGPDGDLLSDWTSTVAKVVPVPPPTAAKPGQPALTIF